MTPLSPTRLRLLVTSLLLVSLLGALDHTIVATSLGTIAGSLGASEQLGWIVISYTLSSAVLVVVLGQLGDRFGPRRVFLIALLTFLLASLACGFAQSMGQLVVARAVQGMSSAGLQLMPQTIIAMVATPRQRPRLLSIVGAAFPIAILVGPVIGGLITDQFGWRWVFWINLPFGLIALVLALIAVPALTGAGSRRFDLPGAVTLSAGMVALVAAVTWVGHPGQGLWAAAAGSVALVCLTAFVFIERRVAAPLLPLGLLRDRTVAAGTALSALIGIGLFSVVSYIPTYIQFAYQTSATTSGLVPIATVFGMLASSLAVGWLVSRTGHYRTYPIVGSAVAAGGLLAMSFARADAGLWVPMVLMGVVGIGTGAFMSLLVAVVQSAAPPSATSTVTATTNLVRQLGATIGTAVIGGALGSGVAARLPAAVDPDTFTPGVARGGTVELQQLAAQIYTDVFAPVFAGLAAVYLLGVVAAILLPRRQLSDELDLRSQSATANPSPSSTPISAARQ